MSATDWQPVEVLLDQFEQAGRQARFWLRDDDAIEATPALDRLIGLCERHQIPLLLAVIPEPATETLARRIAEHPLVRPCQHGFNHKNHAVEGARACELGGNRRLEAVISDLSRGWLRLETLFGGSSRPVLVPPWNRIDAGLLPHLPPLGFRAISTFGRASLAAVSGFAEINAHVDIINWRQGRIGRDHSDLIGKLAVELEIAFASDQPVGVLGHHLVHDETAWGFLEALFAVTAGFSAVRWVSVDKLL